MMLTIYFYSTIFFCFLLFSFLLKKTAAWLKGGLL